MAFRSRHPRIAIFGQAKTGTTALFYRIKRALPWSTRTLFEPTAYAPRLLDRWRPLLAKVLLEIPQASRPVHYDTFRSFKKRIYLVRDPRDWIVSSTLFLIQEHSTIYMNLDKLSAILELLQRKEADPASLPLLDILEYVLQASKEIALEDALAWIGRYQNWLAQFESELGPHHTLRYEDFVDNRLNELETYLGLSLKEPAEVAPAHGHVVRTKSYGNWKHWLLEEDVRRLRPVFKDYLRRHGYTDNWERAPQPTIRPEHCSEYVVRTVRRRLRQRGLPSHEHPL